MHTTKARRSRFIATALFGLGVGRLILIDDRYERRIHVIALAEAQMSTGI